MLTNELARAVRPFAALPPEAIKIELEDATRPCTPDACYLPERRGEMGASAHQPGVATAGKTAARRPPLRTSPRRPPRRRPHSLAALRTSWPLCFETRAVWAITFWGDRSPTPDPLALVILTVWNLLVLWTAWLPERNRGMDSGTFNRSAERKYSAGWTAVPICDIGAAERA